MRWGQCKHKELTQATLFASSSPSVCSLQGSIIPSTPSARPSRLQTQLRKTTTLQLGLPLPILENPTSSVRCSPTATEQGNPMTSRHAVPA